MQLLLEHTTLPGVPEPALMPQAVEQPVGANAYHTPLGAAVVGSLVHLTINKVSNVT